MATITPNKKSGDKSKENPAVIAADLEFIKLPVEQIDFSPLNYRKFFSEQSLNDFAAELKQHGIISR